jgi:lipoprotein-anchoring transpeptidase ErfK/SrfK
MRRLHVSRVAGMVVSLAALIAVAACGGSGRLTATWHASEPSDAPTTSVVVSSLDLVPGTNARNVSPADRVSAEFSNGSLDGVSLKSSTGQVIRGTYDTSRSQWHNTEPLQYATTYTLSAGGSGEDGRQYHESRTFTTVRPNNLTMPYLRANAGALLDNGTFGVGQPIIVDFDEQITDKAAAERSLAVDTDPPGIVGGWYWISGHEVHWRPKMYWPAGTKVTVRVNVFGKSLGGGLYGQANRAASFTIGRSKIMIADAKTHRMKVYIDGKQVTRINGHDVTAGVPVSMGKGGTETTPAGLVIDFTTNSGPHVIMQKFEHVIMRSDSFGITDPHDPNYYIANVGKALQISGDGEYVHLADWNIPQQGHVNTSHGCINVGPTYIYWIYDTFGAGDVVDVTGTNRHLDLRNGLGDWTLGWDAWQKGSALR